MKARQKIRYGNILLSFFILPATYYYLSPYLIIEATINGIINGSLIVFLFLFAGSLLIGRGFCGWLCPAAGCQEAIGQIRKKPVRKGDIIKWIIWAPWIVSIVVISLSRGGYEKIDFFYQTTYGLSIKDFYSLATYFFVLLIIVMPAFAIGRRSFCHHICWMAPFMIIGRSCRNMMQWPSLRLTADSDSCKHCHTCTEGCPMSLPVEAMVQRNDLENLECILCATCIDNCEQKAINYSFK